MPEQPTTHADIRARFARSWDDAPPRPGVPGDRLSVPPGYATFTVGADTGHLVVLPALAPSAPPSVQRRYLARVTAAGRVNARCA